MYIKIDKKGFLMLDFWENFYVSPLNLEQENLMDELDQIGQIL